MHNNCIQGPPCRMRVAKKKIGGGVQVTDPINGLLFEKKKLHDRMVVSNMFIFIPKIGEMIQFGEHFFQMG